MCHTNVLQADSEVQEVEDTEVDTGDELNLRNVIITFRVGLQLISPVKTLPILRLKS